MKDFLTLKDYSKEEITALLDLADQLKYETKNGIAHTHYMAGKTLGMIFQKPSTRTRISFEVGTVQLGGYPLFLSASDLQINRGEEIKDTARVLSRYVDVIMIRTFLQSDVETLAEYSSIPVINGLTDDYHPCQIVADLMTIREYKQSLEGLKICYIGDGNNVANSIVIGCLKMGMNVTVVTPKGYELDSSIVKFAEDYKDSFSVSNNPIEGAKNADVLYTDVWTSMGQEKEKEQRLKDFTGFIINDDILSNANEDALVLHCLPAHKGEEISEQAFEQHAQEIFDEAENRLHAQKAIIVTLLNNK